MRDFLIITGMSGAGRSTAAATFEDLGWLVMNNLPPALLFNVADVASKPGSETERMVLAIGASPYLDDLLPAVDRLRTEGSRVRVLFLEASDEALVRRYENRRRRHPLGQEGITGGIERERELLDPVKAAADVVVDTTDLNEHQLRERLIDMFASDDESKMQTSVVSFGYKHGIPLDVDLVLDCRFLPNPHWIDELRPLTGLDAPVRDYFLDQPETKEFMARLNGLFEFLLPAYVKEGKSYLTVAVGCTGARHRSVVLAEELARLIEEQGFAPVVQHRDVER